MAPLRKGKGLVFDRGNMGDGGGEGQGEINCIYILANTLRLFARMECGMTRKEFLTIHNDCNNITMV
jgi:hypothetical protein